MKGSNEAYVTQVVKNRIATIEFFHPAHNSLPSDLLQRLSEEITLAGKNDQVHFIILRSGGNRTFCAGASFNELAAIQDQKSGKKFFSGFAKVINAIRNCEKIVIGRIQGKAVGGGVGLAAACDYPLASKFASIRLSELAIGIGPFVIGPVVERKVGLAAFSQLALNPSEWQTAGWAKDRGLFFESFDSNEQLDDYIKYYSDKLLNYSPLALAEMKKILWEGTNHWDELLDNRAALSGRLILSHHARKAINSFLSA